MTNRFLITSLCAIVLSLCGPCVAGQESPKQAVVDFDSVLPMNPGPLNIAIYGSNLPDQHIYFVLPNTIQVAVDQEGHPMVGLLHYGRAKKRDKRGGSLSITLRPATTGEVENALKTVQKWDPKASFVIPIPVLSKLNLRTDPKFIDGQIELSPANFDGSAGGSSGFTAKLTPLGTRVFLSPTVQTSNFLVAEYTYRIRGIERGSTGIVERQFTYGLSFSVSCTKYPNSYVNLKDHSLGCPKPTKHWWCPF